MANDHLINLIKNQIDMHARQREILEKSLRQIVGDYSPNFMRPNTDPLAAVQKIIVARLMKQTVGERDLFSDPAWDMMLHLYEGSCRQSGVTVSNLVSLSGVPPTTGLRWLSVLEKRGIVRREVDPNDGRRYYVHLTDEWIDRMRDTVIRVANTFTKID